MSTTTTTTTTTDSSSSLPTHLSVPHYLASTLSLLSSHIPPLLPLPYPHPYLGSRRGRSYTQSRKAPTQTRRRNVKATEKNNAGQAPNSKPKPHKKGRNRSVRRRALASDAASCVRRSSSRSRRGGGGGVVPPPLGSSSSSRLYLRLSSLSVACAHVHSGKTYTLHPDGALLVSPSRTSSSSSRGAAAAAVRPRAYVDRSTFDYGMFLTNPCLRLPAFDYGRDDAPTAPAAKDETRTETNTTNNDGDCAPSPRATEHCVRSVSSSSSLASSMRACDLVRLAATSRCRAGRRRNDGCEAWERGRVKRVKMSALCGHDDDDDDDDDKRATLAPMVSHGGRDPP
eukprot:CAMPEP_0197547978 /NCGR_PEP_ID=MMETSP1320-20131121/2201_1 /TAXON_ID=91990 /ORGANISM="Bolidomonas sp., Strain RCC2347" /LENGTH=340 /DNA_ID=CAMNT_0043107895 /DNA_START=181 /DNA_END=1200 /DNA_ORIENTATION=+